MLLRKLIAAVLSASLVAAQDGGSNTVVENEITVHIVTVGLVPHSFSPNAITANPGDKIMFRFYPGNHSVIESAYGWPCVPRQSINGQEGFYSRPQPHATAEIQTVWNLTITHTGPVFFYCGAPGSCINYGMLGVINPDDSVNLTGQIALAKEARYVLYPGETLPPSAAASIAALAETVLATPTATPTATPSESTAPTENDDKHDGGGLSTGAIVGIAIGGVVVLAILGGLAFYFGRSKGQIKALQESLARSRPEDHAPPEMTVDGVTYVRAGDSRTMSPKPSFLPPYASPESRSKSTDSSAYGHSVPVTTYSPRSAQFEGQGQNRFSGASPGTEFEFYAPTPTRHEMPVAATPAIPEGEGVDVERSGGMRS